MCILKWYKRDSFQKKSNWWQYAAELVSEKKQEGQFSKTTIYYSMLFNLYAYWNETRGTVFKKKHKFITVCYSTRGAVFKKQQYITVWYSTCVRIEMKQEGQFSTKKNTNLLQYAIQLVCVLKWNKRGTFQKKSNWWQYAAELVSEKKQEGQFSKNNNLLLYAIQLVCILKWYKRDSFQKKN